MLELVKRVPLLLFLSLVLLAWPAPALAGNGIPPVQSEARRMASLVEQVRLEATRHVAIYCDELRDTLAAFAARANEFAGRTESVFSSRGEVSGLLEQMNALEPVASGYLLRLPPLETAHRLWQEAITLLAGIDAAFDSLGPPQPHPRRRYGHSAFSQAASLARQVADLAHQMHARILELTPQPGLFDRELLDNVYGLGMAAAGLETWLVSSRAGREGLERAAGPVDSMASRVACSVRRLHSAGPIRDLWDQSLSVLTALRSALRGLPSMESCWPAGAVPLIQGNPVWWNTGAFSSTRP